MNLEAYDVDSLRKIVRELQNENEELREQLHRQNILAAESQAFFICRNEDLYDPDQGARIEHEDHLLYMADEMKKAGVEVVPTEEYGNHYAVIDDQLVWHGGMNLLGKEDVWDNLMRTMDPDAAQELLLMAQNARNNTMNCQPDLQL